MRSPESSLATAPERKQVQANRCPWINFGWRFKDESDCLASFLVLESAEVLAGVKPSNLFRIPGRNQPCGRNLASLWRCHCATLLQDSAMKVVPLRDEDTSPLVLAYDPQMLSRRLKSARVQAFLRRCGYRQPGEIHKALDTLISRVQSHEGMPHEIGVFLGYPLKDIAGFLGWNTLPFTCQRLWKIYGNPEQSLTLARQFENSREIIGSCLTWIDNPRSLLSCSEQHAA